MSRDFETIKYYRDEINKLLEEKPELKELQDQIDKRLENITDKKERARILQEMMLNQWFEITKIWRN